MLVSTCMNEGKTNYLFVNTPRPMSALLVSSKGRVIEGVEDFVYLGSWIASSEHSWLGRPKPGQPATELDAYKNLFY